MSEQLINFSELKGLVSIVCFDKLWFSLLRITSEPEPIPSLAFLENDDKYFLCIRYYAHIVISSYKCMK